MQNIHNLKLIQQIIAAFLISILMGWVIVNALSIFFIFGAAVTTLFLLLILVFAFRKLWLRYGLSKLLLYAFIVASFIGPGLISLKVGPISLFPYRLLLPVAILIYLYYWINNKRISLYGEEPVKPVLIFLFAWIGFALLSLLWAQSITDGVKDIFFLSSGIFFIFLFITSFNKREDYSALFYTWVIVMMFMLAIGYWNYLTKQQLPVSRLASMGAYVQHRPTAVFANENDYASYLALSFFFAFAVFHRYKPGKLNAVPILIRMTAGFLVLSAIFQIYVSESRANLLSVFIGLVFWFLFYTSLKEKRYIVLLGILSGILVMILFPEKIVSIFNTVGNQIMSAFVPSNNAEASTDIRINLLKNALIFITGSFGMGIGAGNVEYYMEHYAELPTAGIVNMHNWWAEIFVHYGIFIFIGYVILYLWLIFSLMKLYRISSANWKDKMVVQALSTSLIAFSLASISPSSFMTLNYSWILIAFTIGYINFRYKTKDELKEIKE
ncbi:O-antigen ligase family protein [Mesobacillus sp.]|uniref:O-antigen ligase family protein n=1 Tax=Mesobacillus sp. TaxID=2675271 RepID=UPI0039F12670